MLVEQPHWNPVLGAVLRPGNRCDFCVWSPEAASVELHLFGAHERCLPMERGEAGYFHLSLDDVQPGLRYLYRVDGRDLPDPASRYQPEGVFGPSEVIDPRFDWHDDQWRGLALADYILYEVHIGTFTDEGTFDAAIARLPDLVDLGVTALELMPISQFPGERNWGYDGVFPFAVQNSYGGPSGLRRFVDACHAAGIALVLDVVYNHFGPEGNHMASFGPYTTDRYKSPWGEAINTDGPYSDEVRRYFIENALYWFYEYRVDALRLDATHFIYDFSARTFMQELIETVHLHRNWIDRHIYLMAEDDRNDANLTRSPERGGWGMDAQWNDDFHHALHTVLTREDYDYYKGFGVLQELVKAIREGFVFTGQYSDYRKRRHGTSSADLPGQNFIIFTQNHDQVGNRMPAERLPKLVSFDALKLAVGVVALSPYIPMIFMGEEYGEERLFNFFTSFQDESLIESIRSGRKKDFAAFLTDDFDPPDPQAESTFTDSKLDWSQRGDGWHQALLALHRKLFSLRKTHPALNELDKQRMLVETTPESGTMLLRRWNGSSEIIALYNFDDDAASMTVGANPGVWHKAIDSAAWIDAEPEGETVESLGELHADLAPKSFALFIKDERAS